MAFIIRNKTASQIIISDLGQFIDPLEEIDLEEMHNLDNITRSLNSNTLNTLGNLITTNQIAIITELGGGGIEVDPEESVQIIGLTQQERNALDSVAAPLNASNPVATKAGLDSKASSSHTHTASEITDFNTAADARITAQKGTNSGLATLDSGGKIPAGQMPAIALSDTFVVSSESAMLALSAQTGDVAVRTDESKSYILKGTDATDIDDWEELVGGGGGAGVTSVNGDAGPTVTLDTDDIDEGLTNQYHTDARVDARIAAADLDDLNDVNASSPSTGDRLQWNGSAWVPVAPSTGTIFGANFKQASSLHESNTGSYYWQRKLRLTTDSIPAGTYRIAWSYEWDTSNDEKQVAFRICQDNSVELMETNPFVGEHQDGNWRHVGGFAIVTFGSTDTHTFDIDFKKVSSGVTCKIRRARLEFWRVS